MQDTKQTLILAGSILVGLALVAGAIFFSGIPGVGSSASADQASTGSPQREKEKLQRLYGDPDAKTTIVEFSDYECPYCSRLHPTLKKVVDESEGAIKWEYRHLPLAIHAAAEPAAIAAECVGDLVGNDAFWSYSTALLANQRGLNTAFLQAQAVTAGVDIAEYQSCIASSEVANRVQDDTQSALSFGGSGTPFSVVVFADGTTKTVSGALPYESWVQTLNSKQKYE